ncbi:hypothetical protein AVEN_25464-1 [Araneus ventricosus]|uniref:Uncharacterized protein n=1 Tax=Araneus ventricosus TaxID=182803 RepID=A0A4Y2N6G6_ARAVE|nr:hypothetical protein AVEN_25464-1 [Araneus ventricosus]
MPGDEVIGDPFQPFLFEVWSWLPHILRHCINTLRGIVKCRANSTTTAIIAVRQVKPFEVGRERSMLREEDNILSNPVSRTETKSQLDTRFEDFKSLEGKFSLLPSSLFMDTNSEPEPHSNVHNCYPPLFRVERKLQ